MNGPETSGGAGPDFDRLGDLLGELGALRAPTRERDSSSDMGRRVAALWADAVGPEIAANTEPLHIKQGRLVVAASSSAWAQTLHLMGQEIRARLNAQMKSDQVKEITFRHAGWEERAGGGGQRYRPELRGAQLSDEQKAALSEVGRLDLDAVLREKITQAMQASFGCGEQDSGR